MATKRQECEDFDCVIDKTDLEIGKKTQGKVRDVYETEDSIVLVATDRLSAFDRSIAVIPCKGRVLNSVSQFWFEETKHIIPNHVKSVPHPNVTIAKKCKVFPIEFVVRGYITGSSNTSLWTHYSKGVRSYCGHEFPDGLIKHQKLEKNILTPTTKSTVHDELIDRKGIIEQGFMSAEHYDFCEKKALELFDFGQKLADKHGLILVDTKYEFGMDSEGNILLVDEIHTPDSSRYWLGSSYKQRMEEKQDPESVDKDIVRRWYVKNSDPYKDETLPIAPPELISTLSSRYIDLFEVITGKTFVSGEKEERSYEGLVASLKAAGVVGQ